MRIAIVGLGLIGASFGRALVEYTSHEVYGYDINPAVLKRADELKAHTRALEDGDLKVVDLVLFALNPDVAIAEMKRICPLLKDGAIVADTCGNKRIIVDEMLRLKAHYPHLRFVGFHPMAGREFSGIEYSTPQLFSGAYMILVPVDGDEAAAFCLRDICGEIGAKRAEICSADKHDRMIAYTSQLAHVVSSCYVQNPYSAEHVGYSAGSFADLTRVARLDAEMWTELFLQNADNLSLCIEDMISRLQAMLGAIKSGDGESLKNMLAYGAACKELADKKRKEDE